MKTLGPVTDALL